MKGRVITCRSCGLPDRLNAGRGLCLGCHEYHRRRGTLIDFERVTRSRDEVLAEYELLRSDGLSVPQIADRLGMKRDSLKRALQRAGVTA